MPFSTLTERTLNFGCGSSALLSLLNYEPVNEAKRGKLDRQRREMCVILLFLFCCC